MDMSSKIQFNKKPFRGLKNLHENRVGLNTLSLPGSCGVINRYQTTNMANSNRKGGKKAQDLAAKEVPKDEPVCDHLACRRTIFVRSVPHSIRRKELMEFFSQFGAVNNVRIHTNCKTRKSKGTAQVQFVNLEDGIKILTLPDEQLICRDKILKPLPSRCQQVWKWTNDDVEDFNSNVESSDSQDCYINTLPWELLNHIFSYLTFKERIAIERVCKLWRHLNSTVPWANIYSLSLDDKYFMHFRKPLNSTILDNILMRCGQTLKSLDFSSCNHQSLSHKFPIIIANHCPNLLDINLQSREISCKSIAILAQGCQKLKKVNLSKCNIGDKWVTKLLKHSNLQEIDLSSDGKITGKNFHLLKDDIRVLNLNHSISLCSQGLDLICNRKSIQKLHLNCCSELGLQSVENMFSAIGNSLVVLDIGGYFDNLNSQVFLEGFEKCHNLEELYAETNCYISDEVIGVISKRSPRLKIVNFSGCHVGDPSLHHLARLENLTNLQMNYIDKISDKGLEGISNRGLLKVVELRACISITDPGCSSLLLNCLQLEYLDISSCRGITDAAFNEAVTNRQNGAKLSVYAGGSGVTNFTDGPTTESIQMIEVNKCPRERRPWNMEYYLDEDDEYENDEDLDYPNYDSDDYDEEDFFEQHDWPEMWDLDPLDPLNNVLYDNDLDEWS